MGRVIAIANQKGGVGKTTTAVNLSACLAEAGKKTLIIDCDPQGNTTQGLGINKAALSQTTYDIFLQNHMIALEKMFTLIWTFYRRILIWQELKSN